MGENAAEFGNRSKWRQWLVVFVKLSVSMAILWWFLQRTSWDEIRLVWGRISWWVVGIGALVYLLKQLVGVLRWQMIARTGGFNDVSLRQYCGYYWVGMYFNLMLPTSVGGDVVRAYYLAGAWKRYAKAFATVVLDRFFGLWILVVAFGIEVVLIDFPVVPVAVRIGGVGLAVLSLLVLFFLYFHGDWLQKIPNEKISQLAGWIGPSVGRTEFLLPVLAWAALAQALVLLVFKLISIGFGIELSWSFLIVFFTLDGLVTILPISLGGIGLREGVAVFCLSQLEIPVSVGLSFGLVFFLIILVTALPGGLIYLAMSSGDDGLRFRRLGPDR